MRLNVLLSVLLIAVIISPAVSQDRPGRRDATVKLKSGEVRTGKFIKADSQNVELETIAGIGPVTIKTDDVASITFLLLASDGSRSKDQLLSPGTLSAKAAVKALRIMAAATEIGINYLDYGNRLIDVKVAVDEALGGIPEGELRNEITSTLLDFQKASSSWDGYIKSKLISLSQSVHDYWLSAKQHLDRAEELLKP